MVQQLLVLNAFYVCACVCVLLLFFCDESCLFCAVKRRVLFFVFFLSFLCWRSCFFMGRNFVWDQIGSEIFFVCFFDDHSNVVNTPSHKYFLHKYTFGFMGSFFADFLDS